ncbi:hypothetical protein [Natronolimnohabitans innermongolicus]|nr:hypothetical protein [Natronolimnohabitans innermongolicus]
MPLDTYQDYQVDDLAVDDETLAYLENRVWTLKEVVNSEYNGGIEEFEEGPPTLKNGVFNPGGWVGEFVEGVSVSPRHLSDDQFKQIVADVQDWTEVIGPETIAASLQFSPDLLLDQKARLSPYSRALETLTEQVLSHRLPVRVENELERHLSPRGQIDVLRTAQEKARRSQQVVSRRTRFHLDSLPNLLLVRFHVAVASELARIIDTHEHYEQVLANRLAYHRSVLERSPFDRLIDQSLETTLSSPEVIDEARSQAGTDFQHIIDLWEGFLRNVNLELALSADFNSALKPMSKTYELWVLRHLLEVTSELAGDSGIAHPIQGEYHIGEYVVHYNQKPSKPTGGRFGEEVTTPFTSRYFEPNLGRSVGEPDFAISYEGETIWIGDAKFKSSPDLDDVRQVLSYAVDLIPASRGGAASLLYANSACIRTGGPVQDYQLYSEPFHPNHLIDSQNRLQESIQAAVNRTTA